MVCRSRPRVASRAMKALARSPAMVVIRMPRRGTKPGLAAAAAAPSGTTVDLVASGSRPVAAAPLLRERRHHGAARPGSHGGGQAQRQHTGNRPGKGARFRAPVRGSPLILEPHAPNSCATVDNGHDEQGVTAKRQQVDAMELGGARIAVSLPHHQFVTTVDNREELRQVSACQARSLRMPALSRS